MARKRLPPELVYEITRCVRAHDGWFGVYASTRMIQNFLAFQLEKWAEVGLITIFDRLRAKEATATQSGSGISLTNKEIRDVLLIGQEIKGLRTLFTVFKATTIPGKAMTDYVQLDRVVALFHKDLALPPRHHPPRQCLGGPRIALPPRRIICPPRHHPPRPYLTVPPRPCLGGPSIYQQRFKCMASPISLVHRFTIPPALPSVHRPQQNQANLVARLRQPHKFVLIRVPDSSSHIHARSPYSFFG
uniref:Uncharacterized protein n=1 Tax=Globodera pallida TaxID=36090 RepID=A0A183CPZ6_GLOPA